ncbi:helix-turn-helix domain-containing protein [Staphylococcus pasteuri]|uniref:helix-turn-helix domain-containing protein n=1 Tax=Staphylococcus pasteuri TaxID=45972 RepID=UPI001E2C367E|nr:helix-turn-helix transcriptional regulator [Staphylococcus pasteuri]MCE3022731.1 helix-turn-helix transcriptional regulator [Staphylococcus pasteuri]
MILCTLSKMMEQYGFTQSYISRETNITRPTLLALIKNENKIIKYETIDALCKFFNINMGELLIYSPIDIKLLSIETDNTEHINFINVKYLINNNIYNFNWKSIRVKKTMSNDKKSFINQLEIILKCDIKLDDYENLLSIGFSKAFFNLYNELIGLKEKIKQEISKSYMYKDIIDSYNLNISITFVNNEVFEDICNNISYLPSDNLNELKNKINNVLKNRNF